VAIRIDCILKMSSTHFGFKTVDEKEKAKHVRGVFD
jgi:demethylmenaquinone methyltransferase/2-methoxy-6-polyprenyl-1,4-benzoquinol methylase